MLHPKITIITIIIIIVKLHLFVTYVVIYTYNYSIYVLLQFVVNERNMLTNPITVGINTFYNRCNNLCAHNIDIIIGDIVDTYYYIVIYFFPA